MNNIGEIQLENEIKILDAFDFPEEFSAIHLLDIQEGKWLVFNEIKEDDMAGEIVRKFLIVEKNYFQNSSNIDTYNWKEQEESISIEKGIVGIFNKNFTDFPDYTDELVEVVSNEFQAGIFKNCVVCNTPFGEDGYFSFDIVDNNNKIVALKINF